MKNRELYFENISEVGDLYLDHIFFSFEDEPILFTCISEINELYLCLCTEIRYEQRWLVSKCKIETLRALIKEEIDVRTALCAQEQIVEVRLNLQCEETSKIIKVVELDELDLPKKGTFLWRTQEKMGQDENYLWEREFLEQLSRVTEDFSSVQEEFLQTYRKLLVDQLRVVNELMDKYKSSFCKVLEKSLRKTEWVEANSSDAMQGYNIVFNGGYLEKDSVVISRDVDDGFYGAA